MKIDYANMMECFEPEYIYGGLLAAVDRASEALNEDPLYIIVQKNDDNLVQFENEFKKNKIFSLSRLSGVIGTLGGIKVKTSKDVPTLDTVVVFKDKMKRIRPMLGY